MKSGDPPTAWNARTGLSTPPGRICLARAKSFWLLTGFFIQETSGLAGKVGDDDVGTRAADGREGFHHRARLVDPAVGARRLQHRILAADLVRGGGMAEARLDPCDDVEVRQRRLDHHDVGAFGDVDLDLAKRLLDVGWIHLVAAAIAELRRGVRRLAERAVER